MPNWSNVVNRIIPYIVQIETPNGRGSGFLCVYNYDKTYCGVATAQHVVDHADEWHQPIRITRETTKEQVYLNVTDRVIFKDSFRDSAVILFPTGLNFPQDLIPLFPTSETLDIGAEVGWLGYPWIDPGTLCFFSGCISAQKPFHNNYLIDGVSIPGVSGGPVVYADEANGVQIVGTVNAYTPNRRGGETLPGLLIAQDVSHFHAITNQIKSIDEAIKKKQELQLSSLSQQPDGYED